jgi:hypothetical protein
VVGQFYPCSLAGTKSEALKKLPTAASRARKALDANHNRKPDEAFRYLNLLFNGNFPAREGDEAVKAEHPQPTTDLFHCSIHLASR